MPTYNHVEQSAKRIYDKSEQLSINVPKVIERRIAMIATQNPLNNAKEMQEMERMVTEKQMAFLESWQSMMTQSVLAQQHIGQMLFTNWVKMAFCQPVSFEHLFYQINNETLKILEQGMKPITRRVTANVERLT